MTAAETFPGQYPHEHVLSGWHPWDRSHIYRHCLVQFCPHIEKREAHA